MVDDALTVTYDLPPPWRKPPPMAWITANLIPKITPRIPSTRTWNIGQFFGAQGIQRHRSGYPEARAKFHVYQDHDARNGPSYSDPGSIRLRTHSRIRRGRPVVPLSDERNPSEHTAGSELIVIPVSILDIDVDSDNNNGLGLPIRTRRKTTSR